MKRKLFVGGFATGVVLLVLAAVAIESVSAAETITDFQIVQDSTNLAVNLPVEFVGATITLESCSNLVTAGWSTILQTNAASSGVSSLGYASSNNNPAAMFYRTTASSTVDSDSDGLDNVSEYDIGTDFGKWDTDGDWLSDGWEMTNSLNALVSDNTLDDDNDGLSNIEEYQWGTDPHDVDSDADGMPDLWELQSGTNPSFDDAEEDPDSDGLENYDEFSVGANPAEQSNLTRSQHSALHASAGNGHLAVMRLLIEAGVDIDIESPHGTTPLLLAAREARLDAVAFLLAHGADVSQKDSDGNTVLHLMHNVEYLPNYQGDLVKTIKILVDAGADVNAKSTDGLTPLIDMCRDGNVEGTRALLAQGANPTPQSKQGNDALHYARFHSKIRPLVEEALGKGVSTRDSD